MFKKNDYYVGRLILSVFSTILLFYFMIKTPSSKVIFIPFLICGIALAGKYLALYLGKSRLAVKLSKLFTVGFLLFWFGFLIAMLFLCVRDANYGTLWFALPFWLAGTYIIQKRFLNNTVNKSTGLQLPIGIVVSMVSVLILLAAGVMLLVQGIWTSDIRLVFVGGFFVFGAFTFVLGALTVKGYFDKCKVDVLGLYVGILFVLIGVGIIAMVYQQEFGFWIMIPVLMIAAGILQITKCLKQKNS